MTENQPLWMMEKVDVHAHFGEMPVLTSVSTVGELEDLEGTCGITRAVCSASESLYYSMRLGNSRLYEVVSHSSMLYMYIYVDPLRPELSLGEIEKYAGRPRVAGIKSRPEYHRVPCDHPAYLEIFRRAAQLKLPGLMHAWDRSDLESAVRLVEKVGTPVILAHVAPRFEFSAADCLRDQPLLYLDPCSTYQDYGRIRYYLDLVGPQRIVLGTDCFLLHPAWTLGVFESAGLTPEEKRLIYRDNALRIFGSRLQ